MVLFEHSSSAASVLASQLPLPIIRCSTRSNRPSRSHWRSRRSASVLCFFAILVYALCFLLKFVRGRYLDMMSAMGHSVAHSSHRWPGLALQKRQCPTVDTASIDNLTDEKPSNMSAAGSDHRTPAPIQTASRFSKRGISACRCNGVKSTTLRCCRFQGQLILLF
jgi:hypothetical protein